MSTDRSIKVAKSGEAQQKLYPNMGAAGGLAELVTAMLRDLGSPLVASGHGDEDPSSVTFARVEQDSRFSQIYAAAEERRFRVGFWSKGVWLGEGSCSDIVEVARAIDFWLRDLPRIRDLAARHSFVTFSPAGEAFEEGGAVEHRWRDYLDNMGARVPELAPFVQAVAATPELRQLFPFTSMNRLRFSRCTGYPYTMDCPIVSPAPDGRYFVIRPDGASSEPLDTAEAVWEVIAGLPAGCGPAVDGTAKDLERADPL